MSSSSSSPPPTSPSSDQMHNDFVRSWPDMIHGLKQAIKEMFPDIFHHRARISVTIRGLQTYPPRWPVTTVMLHELFPVLTGARPVQDRIMHVASSRTDVDSMASYFQCFQTAHHGRVVVMVVTANRNNVTDMGFEVTETSGGEHRLELDSGVPLDRQAQPGAEYKSLALVSVIPFRSDCAGCGEGQADGRRFSRCARCWERLRFPVWYCCRGCQAEHYPQHRRVCGKVQPS